MTKKLKEPVKKQLTTAIEWVKNSDGTAGYAINLWIGCSKISPACDNCYAEISRVSKCLSVEWGDDKPRHKRNPYKKLTAINNKAARQGIRIRVFINPDSDIFDNQVPQDWRDEFWGFVKTTPNIDYILVTKRIGNAKRMLPQSWLDNGYPTNVWQLVTVCNQAEADRNIPKLLELGVSVRGLSVEPMLGDIDLLMPIVISEYYCCGGRDCGCHGELQADIEPVISLLNWIVLGGESGKNARPMNPQWARKIRDQCVNANVPFFFKQWGEWTELSQCNPQFKSAEVINPYWNAEYIQLEHKIGNGDMHTRITIYKIGKKRAGNLLDGQAWQQMPEVKS